MIQELLENLSEKEVALLGEGSRTLELAEGEILYKPEDPAVSLYIIYAGEVRISPGGDETLDAGVALGAGDFFGEMAAIEGKAHTALARAVSPASVVEIEWQCMEELLDRQPKLMRRLTQIIAERIRQTDRRMLEQVQIRAERYRRLYERIALVQEIARKMNELLDWDKVWKQLLQASLRTLSAERGTVYLLDQSRKHLIGQVILGDGLSSITLPVGRGIAGSCALSGEADLVGDAQIDPRFASEFDSHSGFTSRAMICAPFKDPAGQTLGVIQLINSAPDSFTPEDLDCLTLLADQFAQARDRATAAAELVDRELGVAVAPVMARIEKLVQLETGKTDSRSATEAKRASLAFAPSIDAEMKPIRFQTLLKDLLAELGEAESGRFELTGDPYSGFLTGDRALLQAMLAQIIRESIEAGAAKTSLETRDDEERVYLTLTLQPPGVSLEANSLALRLARKVTALHKGRADESLRTEGSRQILLQLALA